MTGSYHIRIGHKYFLLVPKLYLGIHTEHVIHQFNIYSQTQFGSERNRAS